MKMKITAPSEYLEQVRAMLDETDADRLHLVLDAAEGRWKWAYELLDGHITETATTEGVPDWFASLPQDNICGAGIGETTMLEPVDTHQYFQ